MTGSSVSSGKPKMHMMHIGKTGGSAIKYVLREHRDVLKYQMILHSHGTVLRDIQVGEPVILFLRDPLTRFVSGFNSRLRKGQPRNYNEWDAVEAELFQAFPSANDMALALAEEEGPRYELAARGIRHITHLLPYGFWLGGSEYFSSRLADIRYIGFQETLDEDFSNLKRLLGLPDSAALPEGDIQAHRAPAGQGGSLDAHAAETLRAWYADDLAFIEQCRTLRESLLNDWSIVPPAPTPSWRYA